MSRQQILIDIEKERDRQDTLWGKHDTHNDYLLYAVLGEEVGEVATAILEEDFVNLREELVQVAAVAVKWVEFLDAQKLG